MARRRYFRPEQNFRRGPRVNERIRINPIRLIDENEEMVGVIDTEVALQRARDAGLDLVEVSPDSNPPVCRILDFGKYKYDLSKKEKAQKAKSKTTELKEVRLGRSMKIDPHDIEIRLNQAKRFLLEGHKVQIVQNFRGREMMHRDRGDQRMKDIVESLSELGKVEVPSRMAGRRMSMIIAPDKAKVEAYKRKHGNVKPKAVDIVDDHDDDDHDDVALDMHENDAHDDAAHDQDAHEARESEAQETGARTSR